MKSFRLVNNALRVGFAASLLAGCGGSQLPISAPDLLPKTSQSSGIVKPSSANADVQSVRPATLRG